MEGSPPPPPPSTGRCTAWCVSASCQHSAAWQSPLHSQRRRDYFTEEEGGSEREGGSEGVEGPPPPSPQQRTLHSMERLRVMRAHSDMATSSEQSARKVERGGGRGSCLLVGWLFNVPATG